MWRIYGGQIGGELRSAHVHRDEREDQHGLFLDLVLFRLAAPPLHPGVEGAYPVWGVWFPSRLPLKRTSHIQIYGS
jgi:hypothetical protein